jgi:hypothetical protein
MRDLVRILSAISLLCWASLCIAAAGGYMQIDTIDYCLVTGLLAFNSLVTIVRGF